MTTLKGQAGEHTMWSRRAQMTKISRPVPRWWLFLHRNVGQPDRAERQIYEAARDRLARGGRSR